MEDPPSLQKAWERGYVGTIQMSKPLCNRTPLYSRHYPWLNGVQIREVMLDRYNIIHLSVGTLCYLCSSPIILRAHHYCISQEWANREGFQQLHTSHDCITGNRLMYSMCSILYMLCLLFAHTNVSQKQRIPVHSK